MYMHTLSPGPTIFSKLFVGFFSAAVIRALEGTNDVLEARLKSTLEGNIVLEDGTVYPCMPPGYQPGDWKHETPEV